MRRAVAPIPPEVRVNVNVFLPETECETGHEPSFIAETSFVRAPLNSRVGPAPAFPRSKGKGKEQSLEGIPVDIQEALILEDLLFVLTVRVLTSPVAYLIWKQGIEGNYIAYHPDYSPEDDDPLQGIPFSASTTLGKSNALTL